MEFWHYKSVGRELGPIDREDLKPLIQSGEIDGSTPVWKAGMDNWLPIKDTTLADLLTNIPRTDSAKTPPQSQGSILSSLQNEDAPNTIADLKKESSSRHEASAPQAPIIEPDEYLYDAFISYRHVEPDRNWAKWLHSALETYRVPKHLVNEKGLPPRIKKVFRDEDELPASSDLSNEIDTALANSKYLIVVCSPKTPKSEWVNAEVKKFREMGRNGRIISLLIAGKPENAFPRSLCEIRRFKDVNAGISYEAIEKVEPLAADVRPSRNESTGYLKKMALLRISACILGCTFDDLRQREEVRARRKMIKTTALLILIVAITVIVTIFLTGI